MSNQVSNEEYVQSRIAEREPKDREQYQTLVNLLLEVAKDKNATLPYLPAFWGYGKWEQEQAKIQTYLPRIYQARGQEFCLKACEKQQPSCISYCRDFTTRAFEVGQALFQAVHKPYEFTKFGGQQEEAQE